LLFDLLELVDMLLFGTYNQVDTVLLVNAAC